jgi:thiamine-phosphate pyrophosphorylase
MLSKKDYLKKSKIYLLLDVQVNDAGQLFEIARKSVAAGVDLMQLRDKSGSTRDILNISQKVLKLTRGRVPLIINDRVDLALAVKAPGVHLGQSDMPLSIARRLMGNKAIIGISCENLAQALEAQKNGADYIGLGPIFLTQTKADAASIGLKNIDQIVKKIRIPIFAIGGIDVNNLSQLAACGIYRVCVYRAICEAKDIGFAVQSFQKGLDKSIL